MAENPAWRLVRLLGGVLLTQGRLGHQVLGQLLILNATEVEIAGATVVVAATSGQRNAVAQVALRTAAPAVAVHLLARKEEQRLNRLARNAAEKQRSVGEQRIQQLEQQNAFLEQEVAELRARSRAAVKPPGAGYRGGRR